MKELQRIHIGPENAILVIVDMENEFCKPGGKIYGETAQRIMPGVIGGIKTIADRARGAGVPIVYIQSVRTGREPQFSVFNRPQRLRTGTWAVEIVDELKPLGGDPVIQKFCHDPFLLPDLDALLRKIAPDPTRCYAIVTGGAVNVCVYHTVMGFHVRNFWTVVPVDSVYYLDDAGRDRAFGQFSESNGYPNVFLSRSDLIQVSTDPQKLGQRPEPGT